jgi:hypothetical protein
VRQQYIQVLPRLSDAHGAVDEERKQKPFDTIKPIQKIEEQQTLPLGNVVERV